jgi:hypothetical protein
VIDGPVLYTVGAVDEGDVVEIDVTPVIAGNGMYSLESFLIMAM